MTKIRKAWTDTENAGAVALYFLMSNKAHNGQAYNKAEMIREHRGEECRRFPGGRLNQPLSARPSSAIERKLMNVTAVLEDLGRHDVSMKAHGYVPLSNYQATLRPMVVGLLAVRDEAVAGGFEIPGAASA